MARYEPKADVSSTAALTALFFALPGSTVTPKTKAVLTA